MTEELQEKLVLVLWIGGATDTGKTTITQILAQHHHFQFFHYDPHSHGYLERKADTDALYRDFLDTTHDERWVKPEPLTLLQITH